MLKKFFVSTIVFLNVYVCFAQSNDLLNKIDSYRLYSENGFCFDYEIIEETEKFGMKVYVKKGTGDTILTIYKEPSNLSGRKILVTDNSFWLQDNRMQSAVKISAQQMLVGQASAGDITNIVFSKSYDVVKEDIVDNLRVLELVNKNKKGGNYQKVILYADLDSSCPVKALLYSKSDLHLKTIEYEPLELINGKEMITSFKIINELNSQVSRIVSKNFSEETLSDRYFTREGMQNLR